MLLTLASIAFITFGDWGAGTDGQRAVAKAAQQYCAQTPCEFVLTLGDNFYELGVRSTKDAKWRLFYRDIYKDLNLPFYAVLGNHDEYGNIQAQMDYAKIDNSWHMPGPYYSIPLPEGSDRPVLEIFVINNGDDLFQPDEKAWLTAALAKSRARWKILAMHKPMISNAPRGDDTSHINDPLTPVICGKVDLILSGHDHIFSHLKGHWNKCAIDQLI
ncbi:MAG: metallophosphoesterase, partial [Candidatus Uhrbacteria bacterium]|nr:metallophosphoesterase [Candidatus Uhrbacteria bacterium]